MNIIPKCEIKNVFFNHWQKNNIDKPDRQKYNFSYTLSVSTDQKLRKISKSEIINKFIFDFVEDKHEF